MNALLPSSPVLADSGNCTLKQRLIFYFIFSYIAFDGNCNIHCSDRKQIRNIDSTSKDKEDLKCLLPLFCKIGMKE